MRGVHIVGKQSEMVHFFMCHPVHKYSSRIVTNQSHNNGTVEQRPEVAEEKS